MINCVAMKGVAGFYLHKVNVNSSNAYDIMYLSNIEKLYIEMFSEAERRPFNLLVQCAKEGKITFYALVLGTKFVGFMIIIIYKDIVALDYFAINKEYQDKGYGSNALRKLLSKFSGSCIIVEIEEIDYCSNNVDELIKRKSFYVRNGFSTSNLFVSAYNVNYEILSNDCNITFDEYLKLNKHICGEGVSSEIRLLEK